MNWQSIESAPEDGTVFLAWREVPTYDEDLRKTVIHREPCVAQIIWGSVGSIPFHAIPQGERITHWMQIPQPPANAPCDDMFIPTFETPKN